MIGSEPAWWQLRLRSDGIHLLANLVPDAFQGFASLGAGVLALKKDICNVCDLLLVVRRFAVTYAARGRCSGNILSRIRDFEAIIIGKLLELLGLCRIILGSETGDSNVQSFGQGCYNVVLDIEVLDHVVIDDGARAAMVCRTGTESLMESTIRGCGRVI